MLCLDESFLSLLLTSRSISGNTLCVEVYFIYIKMAIPATSRKVSKEVLVCMCVGSIQT